MTTASSKMKRIAAMSEDAFRKDLLIPLLRRMGYKKVRERHGSQEYGKDIVFIDETPLVKEYCAIVAKSGRISGAAKGRQNLQEVMVQAWQAFDMPFNDVEEKKKHSIDKVFVWATDRISSNAETQIVESLSSHYRNVSFKAGEATLELLEEHYPAFFTIGDPHVSDYYGTSKDYYSRIEELRTLGCSSEAIHLPVIFVPPHFREYLPWKKSSSLIRKTFRYSEILRSDKNTLIIGDMGTGKSTVLRRMLIETIERNEAKNLKSPIPILVKMKALDLSSPTCIEDEAIKEFHRFSPYSASEEYQLDFGDGEGLLLLDGLDELNDDDLVVSGLSAISSFISKYPKARVVLTSRVLRIFEKPELLDGFQAVKISEVTTSQSRDFISKWFGKESTISIRLNHFLKDPLTMSGLPSTPMTLAIVAILYSSGVKEIPANLTELFTKYTELALGRWDEGKDLQLQVEWKIKQFLLRGIAWELHQEQSLTMEKERIDKIIQKLAYERGIDFQQTHFWTEIVDRSELLFESDEGVYEFKHRSFQDFFAAVQIDARADAVDFVVSNFLDMWWENAVFFACGLNPESAEFLSRIMEEVHAEDKDLAAYAINLGLASQASYLAPRDIKKRAIELVLRQLTESWNFHALRIEERRSELDQPEIFDVMSPHLFLLTMYTVAAERALGSLALSELLREVAGEYIKMGLGTLSPDQRVTMEWRAFFLAAANAYCDNIAEFVGLIGSDIITDPLLYFVAKFIAQEMKGREWIPKSTLKEVEKLSKKLDRSVKSNMAYIQSYTGKGPLLLPTGSNEQ